MVQGSTATNGVLQCQVNARIHGWTAGWLSLQYVDREEEAAFVAKEFMNSRAVIVSITASQLAIISTTVMRMQDGLPTPAFTVIQLIGITLLVQLCARVALVWVANQLLAARIFGVVATLVTLSQWAVVIHVQRTTGYSILDAYGVDVDAAAPSAAFFLVLGLLHMFLQGLISALSNGYCALRTILLSFVVTGSCGFYLHLHVPEPDWILLTEIELFAMFVAIVISCVALSLAQLHSRRGHLAQVAFLAEELAQQRDRLQYDLSFAEKRAAGSLRKHGAWSASALSSAVGELDAALGAGRQDGAAVAARRAGRGEVAHEACGGRAARLDGLLRAEAAHERDGRHLGPRRDWRSGRARAVGAAQRRGDRARA